MTVGSEFKVIVRDTAGVKQAVITDFYTVSYRKKINEPGVADILLAGDHALRSEIEHNWQVEVQRRNLGMELDWYVDFYGLYRAQKRNRMEQSYWRMRCPGQMVWLNGRWVMWKSGTADRSEFSSVAAETIMKTLVDYNAGPNATTGNGRERDGTRAGLSIETDGGNGNSLDWNCAWKPLLGELQKLARVAGGDFDLIKTGAATWEFRWYTGQRGTDLTADVIFSVRRGNMASPVYEYDRMDEYTVAVVGGQGVGAGRDVSVVTGPDYGAANDEEIFVDARSTGTAAGRQAAGNRALDERRAREKFGFDVLQTPATFYGKHYCEGQLGDLVTARYDDDVETTQKIVGVTVTWSRSGKETVGIDMETQ